jgi:hypothetical protein
MPGRNGGSSTYVKLEQRLVLLAWLNSLFGYRSNQIMLTDIREADEGFDAGGRSYIFHRLAGRAEHLRIPLDDLVRYDDNIKAHLDAINRNRTEPITLRYFQYLAVLYAEVFLDWYFNKRQYLLRMLNDFVEARNSRAMPGEIIEEGFTENDLRKLAFWMATGSGKTLIMHCNYRQFLQYNTAPVDNILLITPNAGLTEQHIDEMVLSGIPCERFNLEDSGLMRADRDVVRVIEITKLVEQKRGGGVTVDVEAFQGNNLVFVDEGHKGSGGEAWRRFRDRLGETGFTFEYSATFGQALTATRSDRLTAEYGKAIAFDYSYRYFHGDGFGKDFHILNLRSQASEEQTDELLLGNLLSFYEQMLCFENHEDSLGRYNLEKPLWVFVGSTVQKSSKQERSDVLTVVRFLQRFLVNRANWAVKTIGAVMKGKTDLDDPDGEDIFSGKFQYLRGTGLSPRELYTDLMERVFGSKASGSLCVNDIRASAGELGLQVSGANQYFGLIYIGDTSEFKKLLEEDESGIFLAEDVVSESLFSAINDKDGTVNLLIGAKKFMEGWNSWRVSSMGLLNVGRQEGSQIIQLFGRGVRLRGLDFRLRRSSAMDGEHPAHIGLLEILNLFAIRADYMAQFREYLELEGVETEGSIELPLPIKANRRFLDRGLVVPRVPDERDFTEESSAVLAPDAAAKVFVDLSVRVESIRSGVGGVAASSLRSGQERTIPAESLELLDWHYIYLQLLEFKEQKGFSNIIIPPHAPLEVVSCRDPLTYRLVASEDIVAPRTFEETTHLREAVLTILRKYIEKFYWVQKERWDSDHMVYKALDNSDPNLRDYSIRVQRSHESLIRAIRKLIEEGNRIYEEETRELPNIHFDRHIYQPLLLRNDRLSSKPPGLEESEKTFVQDLRDFVRERGPDAFKSSEIYLLRNLGRGKGVGFFQNQGFYPDFILWVKGKEGQRIVFIEPHGMRQEKAYWTSEKARLHERLGEMSIAWNKKEKQRVTLDSFIVSKTPYNELRDHYGEGWSRGEFSERHILFFERSEDYDYVEKLLAPQD